MLYLSSFAWLISLRRMKFRSICVVTSNRFSSFYYYTVLWKAYVSHFPYTCTFHGCLYWIHILTCKFCCSKCRIPGVTLTCWMPSLINTPRSWVTAFYVSQFFVCLMKFHTILHHGYTNSQILSTECHVDYYK